MYVCALTSFLYLCSENNKLMAMQNLENNLRGAELRGICREKNGLQVELDYSDLNR